MIGIMCGRLTNVKVRDGSQALTVGVEHFRRVSTWVQNDLGACERNSQFEA